MRREPWKLKDVVMMAILGVLFAVVYMAVFYGGTAISVCLLYTSPSPRDCS